MTWGSSHSPLNSLVKWKCWRLLAWQFLASLFYYQLLVLRKLINNWSKSEVLDVLKFFTCASTLAVISLICLLESWLQISSCSFTYSSRSSCSFLAFSSFVLQKKKKLIPVIMVAWEMTFHSWHCGKQKGFHLNLSTSWLRTCNSKETLFWTWF